MTATYILSDNAKKFSLVRLAVRTLDACGEFAEP